ncbi:ABC-type multidrug transport system, ATPase and permease component [Rubrivivax sp. A210]|uniref:ABC transporter ATP-binding protein n=1 Tax=Rubrivivax sp. A210 TaxID=2772301 RepID=UPI001918457C|nr:ABC transporter ATP-binding protein [Rubrivivax sp. A210]CAD5373922.1 ABC-type multidrug transport system, ATPase and permease component [Rubrivivax sp. A210]
MKTLAASPLGLVIRDCLKAQRGGVLLACLCLLGVIAMDLIAPWPLKVVFDHLLLPHPLPPALSPLQGLLNLGTWPALLAMAGAIAAIALLAGVFSYLQLFTTAKIGYQITYRLRSLLFAHLQRLSLAYHRGHRSGELLTKVASDTNQLRDMFADWALSFVAQFLTLVTMLGVMFWLNWQLAAVVTATLLPLMGVIYALNKRVKESMRDQRKYEGRMTSRLNEVLSSIALVQAFGRQSYEEGRFEAEIKAHYESGMRSTRTAGAVTKAIAVVCASGTAATVLLGAQQVLAGRLTPGELLIFLAYVGSLFKPVRDLGKLSAKFTRAAVSAQRVNQILETAPEIADAPDAIDIGRPAGEIVFEDVSFGYADGRPVLDRVSLRIAAGERVALVGPSGSGKSTLLSLLLRLYEPSGGRILIDGIDIRRFTRESLRAAIGIVPQENMLFAVSVRENIAYGNPLATAEQIEEAARHARAHEFVVDLPEGYDTEVGERGGNLSGGQRQRLCLARALVKAPSILVMDEPTASVDAVSARLMTEAVARVHRNRTLITISHEYNDMAAYDRILVLQDGRLVESGAHEALMQARGPYLALVERRHAV